MDKNPAMAGPTRHDELAPTVAKAMAAKQHSEVVWFTRGSKCGGCAGEHRALTWGTGTKWNRRRSRR